MVPFSRNADYIGTSQKIKDQLNRHGDQAGGHRRLALWGLGGVGYVDSK